MEFPHVHNGGLIFSQCDGFVDRCIRFYKRKFHYISIPIGIIFSIIHLKFSIEYLGQCPIQPMINIYMIVHASIALLLILLTLIGVMIVHCLSSQSQRINNNRYMILIVTILTLIGFLFSLIWLIFGSIWIFTAKMNGVQGSNSQSVTYCQSDFYRAAFVLLLVNYIVHVIIVLFFILRYFCCKNVNSLPSSIEEKDKV